MSYVYDPAGNLIQRGTTTYSYDWQNHLVSVNQNGQVTSFGYDADGNLAKRTDPDGTITDNGVRTYLYTAALNFIDGSSNGASVLYTPVDTGFR